MQQSEFPHQSGLIYLNHAGVAPWPRRSVEAVHALATENLHRGAAGYRRWLDTERALRERLARLVNAPSTDDVALVKNTSEGLSFVAYGLDWHEGDAVIINRDEFPSNRIVWESLRERFGVEVRDVDLASAATPEDALIAAMDRKVRLLAVSSVQYASGLRMDLARLSEACRRHDILFCLDAIQSLGALRLDAPALEIDFVIADGHKWMLGPEGLGLFYSRPQARERLQLTQYGWHMVENAGDFDSLDWQPAASARRFEAGSPNMLGVFALEASLGLLEELGAEQLERQVLANAAHLIERIDAEPALQLLTPRQPTRHAGIVSFRVNDRDNEAIYRRLMEQNVICAYRGGGIRFSPHFYNEAEDLDRALQMAVELGQPLGC